MEWSMVSAWFDCKTTFLSLTIILVAMYFYFSKRPKNQPPGPSGVPILGYIPFLGDHTAETLRKLKVKYGSIMSVQFGNQDWIVLNDYKAINEAFVKQGDVFSGRPRNFIFELMTEGCGVAPVDYGQIWRDLRKFGVMTLRGFGVGKKGMEANVIEETPFLVENLITKSDLSLQTKLSQATSNIICRVVLGSRFPYNDKRFIKLLEVTVGLFSDNLDSKLFGIVTLAPVLRFIPPFKGALKRLTGEMELFMRILKDIITEHETNYDENDMRDFTDCFLKEIKTTGNNNSAFCLKQLRQYIRDLFQAGTGTTASTLYWAILCFANYPEHQVKIADEIESVIGESGIPTMKHCDKMPYTCAFIQEIMRHRTLLPLGGFHKTTKRTTLYGYTIPKDTTIIPNLWAVHFDPEHFENPTDFRPERFIDDDGKFMKSNHVIPFSVGPRHCLGEHLARMEIFVFLTGIVQKLKVVPDPLKPVPKFESGTYINMMTYEAALFEVNFELR